MTAEPSPAALEAAMDSYFSQAGSQYLDYRVRMTRAIAAAYAIDQSPAEGLAREQAAAWRERAPLLDRLHALASQRDWQLGRNLWQCAIEDLESMAAAPQAAKHAINQDAAEFQPDIREEMAQDWAMIRRWIPDSFPANEKGQVHFVRAVVESVADVMERALAEWPEAAKSPED